jgi:hypothetical protein
MKRSLVSLALGCAVLCGCASTAPTPIGDNTYFAARNNSSGMFGDVSAVEGKLIVQGNHFCSSKGKKLELVTASTTSNVPGVRLGGASITFKCVERSRNPNGVTAVN